MCIRDRLGTPKEFAENTAEQLGIDSAAPQKRKGIISSVAAPVSYTHLDVYKRQVPGRESSAADSRLLA